MVLGKGLRLFALGWCGLRGPASSLGCLSVRQPPIGLAVKEFKFNDQPVDLYYIVIKSHFKLDSALQKRRITISRFRIKTASESQ